MAHQTPIMNHRSFTRAAELSREAAELAERHGWTGDPAFGLFSTTLAAGLTWQARLGEAERRLQSAERPPRAEAQPAMSAAIHFVRGTLEMARNRDAEALAAFQAAGLLARRLASPHYLIAWMRGFLLLAPVRLGLLSGTRPQAPARPRPLLEALSKGELRVLRYLTAPEIAGELYVSRNTVRTHVKSLYAKLGTHHRTEAVERARALDLLAASRTAPATC